MELILSFSFLYFFFFSFFLLWIYNFAANTFISCKTIVCNTILDFIDWYCVNLNIKKFRKKRSASDDNKLQSYLLELDIDEHPVTSATQGMLTQGYKLNLDLGKPMFIPALYGPYVGAQFRERQRDFMTVIIRLLKTRIVHTLAGYHPLRGSRGNRFPIVYLSMSPSLFETKDAQQQEEVVEVYVHLKPIQDH